MSAYRKYRASKYKRARSDVSRYRKYRRVSGPRKMYRRRGVYSVPKSNYGWRGNLSMVRRAVNAVAEKKWVDTGYKQDPIYDGAGTVLRLLNGIAVGDSQSQRIGRQVTITSVMLEGAFLPLQLLVEAQRVRVLLVWDASPNGVGATADQILTLTTPVAVNNSYQFMNLNFRNRFSVLAEETFTIGFIKNQANTIGADTINYKYSISPVTANVSRFVKMNHRTTFSGNDATVGSIATGALYLLVVGGNNVSSDHFISFCSNVRVRYTDV